MGREMGSVKGCTPASTVSAGSPQSFGFPILRRLRKSSQKKKKSLVSILQTTATHYHLWVKSAAQSMKPTLTPAIKLLSLFVSNFPSFPFLNSVSTPRIKEELVSIKFCCICQMVNYCRASKSPKALGLPLLLGKTDLFLNLCYHDGETLTDLEIPQGVIFLTASNPVFFFLNITYWSNKKQVWGWNPSHRHISPLSQWCVI